MNISFVVADRPMDLQDLCSRYNICKFDVLMNNPDSIDLFVADDSTVKEGTAFLVPPSSLTNNFRLVCDNVIYPHTDPDAERTILQAIRKHVSTLAKQAGYATISKAQRYLLDPKARSTINIRFNTVKLRRDTSADELLRSGCFDFAAFAGIEGYCTVSGRGDKFTVNEMLSGPPPLHTKIRDLYVRGRQQAPNNRVARSVVLPARRVIFKAGTELPARKYQPDAVTEISHVQTTQPVGSLRELDGDKCAWVLHLCGQETNTVHVDDLGNVFLAALVPTTTDIANSIGFLTTFEDKYLFTQHSDLTTITMFSGDCPHKTEVLSLDFLIDDIDDIPDPGPLKRARTASKWPPSENETAAGAE